MGGFSLIHWIILGLFLLLLFGGSRFSNMMKDVAKGTLDVLMEAGWVRITGRREVPGRPVIYATTPDFLAHFGLASLKELPGVDELRAAGLLDPVDDDMIETELARDSASAGAAAEDAASGAEDDASQDDSDGLASS